MYLSFGNSLKFKIWIIICTFIPHVFFITFLKENIWSFLTVVKNMMQIEYFEGGKSLILDLDLDL